MAAVTICSDFGAPKYKVWHFHDLKYQFANEGMEPKQKEYPAVDVTGDRSKVWCWKEQYCIGTWNVRSMNQGKLEVVEQEMAIVNIDILEINVFLELSCFFSDPAGVGNLISGSSAFSKSSLNIWNFTVHVLLKPGLENFEHYFAVCEMSVIVQ